MDTTISELITVVIPSIPERDGLLKEALESVMRQTIGAPKVVFLVDHDKVGPATMRNRMVADVTTPWVQFLDDDDVLHENYFETLLPHLDSGDVVYTWCVEEGFSASLDRPFNAETMRQGNHVPVTACVRVGLFNDVGGFPEDAIYEDWGLWLRLMDKDARFVCVPEKRWTYRRHGGSRTHVNQKLAASGGNAAGTL